MKTAVFPGRFDSLAPISHFVEQAAALSGLDERSVYAIQTAVDEACSNIIDHAYGGEGNGDITIACSEIENGFQVELRDNGRRFNPDSVPDPDLSTDLEHRKIRGLGLYFIRKLMDEVHFDFSEQGNTLTLIKYKAGYKPAARSTTPKSSRSGSRHRKGNRG